jgi:hypothetical protein
MGLNKVLATQKNWEREAWLVEVEQAHPGCYAVPTITGCKVYRIADDKLVDEVDHDVYGEEESVRY